MNVKQIESMQGYLDKSFVNIQHLQMQATESNCSAIMETLNALRAVYNALETMKKDGGAPGGQIPNIE